MTFLDIISLLLTGVISAYLVFRLYKNYKNTEPKPRPNIPYMAAFIVLLVSGLLLLIFGLKILPSPAVIVVTSLIPLSIAVGLYCDFYKEKLGTPFKIFALLGLLAIILTRFVSGVPHSVQVLTVIIVHSIAGVSIFVIPILAVKNKKAPRGFIFVTVGEVLIGLGGIALAFLKSGDQLLFFSHDFVMFILSPLLILMTLAFTYGFISRIEN